MCKHPILCRLTAVLAAAAFFVSGCYHHLPFQSKTDGSVVMPCRQVSRADRAGYTVAMVERAMRRYDAQGREAMVEYYNSPESVDGEWYVFVFDENEKLIALAVNPDTLGADFAGRYRGGFHRLPAWRSDSGRNRGRDVGRLFLPQSRHRHPGVETFLGGTARRSDFPDPAGIRIYRYGRRGNPGNRGWSR